MSFIAFQPDAQLVLDATNLINSLGVSGTVSFPPFSIRFLSGARYLLYQFDSARPFFSQTLTDYSQVYIHIDPRGRRFILIAFPVVIRP